ncbi:MAG: hypothetical protein SPL12_04935 [Bacteroidales bacterium]|nr:hypothetical protein [Bacteroidales bacterium]
MKQYRKTILWAMLAVMLLGVASCGEKDTASRFPQDDLLGRWQYYTMLDPTDPNSLQPGVAIQLMKKNEAVVEGQSMHWTYESDVVSAQRVEGNVVYWLKFKVINIDKEQGLMSVSGAHGWCENVAGTEWGTDRMAGHSWPLEQPGFFAAI